MSTPRIAVFPGSFDPITNGHLDLIARAARLFDEVVVAILINPNKQSLFELHERRRQIEEACARVQGTVRVDAFEGLVVEYARRIGAVALVRGLRNGADFDYEQPMVAMNAHLAPSVDTVCLLASASVAHISSRLVKEIAALGGDVSGLVPAHVESALRHRVASRKE